MKILWAVLVGALALTACSSSTVIGTLPPTNTAPAATAPANTAPANIAEADLQDPTPTAPEPVEIEESAPTDEPAVDAQPVHWCDGPAQQARDAFADTIWADRPDGMPLEQALNGLLQALIAVRPWVPEELEQALADAIETQVEVNAALDGVDWDRSAIDWNTVTGLRLNEESTVAIDEYGERMCGLRRGFLIPASGSPDGGREVNDDFADRVEEVVATYGMGADEARCAVAVVFDYPDVAPSEVRDELVACGVPPEKVGEWLAPRAP